MDVNLPPLIGSDSDNATFFSISMKMGWQKQ